MVGALRRDSAHWYAVGSLLWSTLIIFLLHACRFWQIAVVFCQHIFPACRRSIFNVNTCDFSASYEWWTSDPTADWLGGEHATNWWTQSHSHCKDSGASTEWAETSCKTLLMLMCFRGNFQIKLTNELFSKGIPVHWLLKAVKKMVFVECYWFCHVGLCHSTVKGDDFFMCGVGVGVIIYFADFFLPEDCKWGEKKKQVSTCYSVMENSIEFNSIEVAVWGYFKLNNSAMMDHGYVDGSWVCDALRVLLFEADWVRSSTKSLSVKAWAGISITEWDFTTSSMQLIG